jgi:hypothetical protein
MIGKLLSVFLIACAVAALAAPHAMAQGTNPFNMEPLADEELGNLRGGFFTAGGYTFDFGAIVRTTVDGQPALEQRLTWSSNGATVEDVSGKPASQLPGIGGIGLDLSDATGTTLVGHRLVDGQIQGFIVNSGSNRDIGQDIQINLTLPGFDMVQKDMLASRLGIHIDMDISAGLVAASSR